MKKIITICGFVLLNLSSYGQQYSIKINPLSLVIRTLNLQGEIKTRHNQTFQLGLIYLNRDYELPDFGLNFFAPASTTYSREIGYGVTPEYRFYFPLQKSNLLKMYVGPYYRFLKFNIKETTEYENPSIESIIYETKMERQGGGVIVGMQLTFESFLVDFYVGGHYMENNYSNTTDSKGRPSKPYISGFMYENILPRFGVAFGFSNMK